MREIPLTNGMVALVDDEDYARLVPYKWYALRIHKTWYAARRDGDTLVLMHRQIMNPPAGWQVDHIDHNGLLNVRSNLRPCTPSQNRCNTTRRPCGPDGYRGVIRSGTFYRALVTMCSKKVSLGPYNTPLAAALAYDQRARLTHGEFAALNFPSVEPTEEMIIEANGPEPARPPTYRRHHNKRAQCSSSYIGVSWQSDIERFTAKITVQGKRLYLGSFRSERDAVLAYNAAATRLLGQAPAVNEVTQ